jgi:hypothetical protein
MKTNPILLALIEVSLLLPFTAGAAQFCTNGLGRTWVLVPGSVNLNIGFSAPGTWLYRHIGGAGYFSNWSEYIFDDIDLVWTPQEPNHFRGEAFLIYLQGSSGNISYCFPQPTQSPVLPLTLYPGVNLVCCQSNIPATYEDIVGAAPAPGTRLLRLKRGVTDTFPDPSNDYVTFTYLSSGWSPSTPIAAAGEGVVILIGPFIQDPAIVNGRMEFDVYSPAGSQITIERTDSLTSPQWQTLSTLTAVSHVTHVTDPDPISAHTGRYYRARL